VTISGIKDLGSAEEVAGKGNIQRFPRQSERRDL
jgi:hypothetical protein